MASLLLAAALAACGREGISSAELVGVWTSSDGEGATVELGADGRFLVRGLPREIRPRASGSAPRLDGCGSWSLPTSGMHANRVRLAFDAGEWSDVQSMDELHVAGSGPDLRLFFLHGDVDSRGRYLFDKR